MLSIPAPSSSTAAPVVQRRLASRAASMAARRSRASRSILRSINTASRWRSPPRRRMSMTARASFRCCISLPASRGLPWAISAIAASGCPRGAWHHHPTQRRRSWRNLHSGGYSGRALAGLDQPLPPVEHHLREDRGAPRRFHRDRLHLDPVPPPGAPCDPRNQRLTSTNSFSACRGPVLSRRANDQVALEVMYWNQVLAVSSHVLCW